MSYEVIARTRANYKGFRRSGRCFSSEQPTPLSNEEMTPEILADPMLIVTELPDEPETLEEMTIKELEAFATSMDFDIPKQAKKRDDILTAIQAELARLEAEKVEEK